MVCVVFDTLVSSQRSDFEVSSRIDMRRGYICRIIPACG